MSKGFLITVFFIWSLAFFSVTPVHAQSSSIFTVYNQGTQELKIDNQGFGYPSEITPMVLGQPNGSRLYLLSTGWSWLCSSSDNILSSTPTVPIRFTSQNCKLITKPRYLDTLDAQGAAQYISPPASTHDWTDDWRRTYDGMLGFQLISTSQGTRLIGVRHGEHANAKFGNFSYQGSVFPNVSIESCWSGYQNGVYQQCWDSFAGFTSLAYAPFNSSTGWQKEDWVDLGPPIWPSRPYRQANGTRNFGASFYHPTLFTWGNFMYLYPISLLPDRPGGQCVGVSRAPKTEGGVAGTWKNFTRGSFSVDSLPAGFSKENIRNFYSTPGGAMDCIFPEEQPDYSTDGALYFNVAKIKNSPFFLGVEEVSPSYATQPTWKMGVRISRDLIHWSPVFTLSSHNGAWGTGQQFSYPTFYNRDATSNYEIDPTEFYIVGVAADNAAGVGGYKLNRMKLAIRISSGAENDINGDSAINIYDYNQLVAQFGKADGLAADLDGNGQVDIYDYNQFVAKFGRTL